ncbi:MAG TPA: CHASE3 domain-containing protein [Bryobacteraceae bacterium]|nr:CHASE3 domain-containing protein [Bryobacteraceae bacterium]
MRRIRRPGRWYLAGALLILVGVAFLSYQDWTAFQRSAPQVQHSRQMLQQVEDTMSSIRDAESGQRGFLLTGNPEYLDAYHVATAALPAELNALRRSVSNEPELRPRVDTLANLVTEKVSELQDTVQLRQAQGFQAALDVVQSNRGKHAMDDVRKIGADLENEIYAGLLQGIRERQQQGSRTRLTTAAGAAVLFLFLLFATFDIGRATSERDRLILDLASANERTTAGRDLLHTTLSSIGDAVVATDAGGRVTFMNGIAEALTGWTQAGAQGRQVEEVLQLINEDTRSPVENPVTQALQKGAIVGLANHTVLIARDGAERPIDDSAAPIRNAQAQTIGAVLVFRDVTRRRQAEEETQRLNRDLTRTNQDLQQFSYAASHDLKEPLRTVSNYLQLIRSRYSGKVLDEEAAKLFGVAVAGAQRMHALVEALLEYSRSGQIGPSTLESIRVDEVVRDAITNLQSSITEAGADVAQDPLPVLKADPLQLTQVFENLIGNAIKYRSEQPPRIRITATESAEDWVFAVEDNGIGIPPEYQAQIFGIFKRLHGSEYPGTGIGLATCKKIVERHGGDIWVESTPGQGSRFCFTLPRSAQPAAQVKSHSDGA